MRSIRVAVVFLVLSFVRGNDSAVLSNPELLQKASSEIMVILKDSVSPILRELAGKSFNNRGAKLNAIVTTLKASTALSQAPVVAALKPFKVDFKSFWISNRIYIKNANPALIKLLESLEQVKEIRVPRFPSFPPLNPIEGNPPEGTEWNVEIIKAPEVWRLGSNGTGVIVLGIDTGVKLSHNAIKDAWVGLENKGWLDAWYRQKMPGDINGHGTHTIATVLGRTGTGMAPGAQWMACRACDTQGCPEPHLLECGEFSLCPTDSDGRNSKCDLAPHIVTNSWGGGNGDPFFDDVINAWQTSGTVVIFAIGNDGPKCETAASPGDRDGVLAVGATDKDDKIAGFSSRGPRTMTEGLLANIPKPQISAPGHKVNSAFIGLSDDTYRVLSGTSMACPAVAGAAALLMQAKPDLTTDDITRIFTETADRDLPEAGTCGNGPSTEFPNEVYGYGRINVLRAYEQLLSELEEGSTSTTSAPPAPPADPTIKSKVK